MAYYLRIFDKSESMDISAGFNHGHFETYDVALAKAELTYAIMDVKQRMARN